MVEEYRLASSTCRGTRPGLPWWILAPLVALLVLAGTWTAWRRQGVERANRTVELVLDYYETSRLAEAVELPPAEVVARFREAGITTLAVGEYTMADYLRGGSIVAVRGRDLVADEILGRPLPPVFAALRRRERLLPQAVYFVAANAQAEREFDAALRRRFRPEDFSKTAAGGRAIWKIRREYDWLLGQNLGLAPDQLRLARRLDLWVAPRWSSYPDLTPGRLRGLMEQLPPGEGSVAIFSGKQILGYPGLLEDTAQALAGLGLHFGFIEFANQDGEEELAKRAGYRVIRVHSITAREMEKIQPEVAAARDLRAVRERGIRAIYLRPFLSVAQVGREGAALDFNLRYIKNLRERLEAAGFIPGRANPAGHLPSPLWALAAAAAGALAGGTLLLRRYVRAGGVVEAAIIGVGTLGAVAASRAGYDLLVRQLFALGAAVVFPTLGVLAGRNVARNGWTARAAQSAGDAGTEGPVRPSGARRWGRALGGFFAATGLSLLGALAVVAFLGQNRFLTALTTFSGVKVLHAAPLLLVWFVLLRARLEPEGRPGGWRSLGTDLRRILAGPVTWEQAWLVVLGAGVLAFYLLRTGTYVNVPVLEWERMAREALERWLVVRPRTKEFLIGQPALLLALLLEAGGASVAWLWPAYLAGAIGQLSMVSTFSHIHTPLWVSAVRTALGLLLGVAVGVAAYGIFRALELLARRVRRAPEREDGPETGEGTAAGAGPEGGGRKTVDSPQAGGGEA